MNIKGEKQSYTPEFGRFDRVVKVSAWKALGRCPRRFESCSRRSFFALAIHILKYFPSIGSYRFFPQSPCSLYNCLSSPACTPDCHSDHGSKIRTPYRARHSIHWLHIRIILSVQYTCPIVGSLPRTDPLKRDRVV